MIRTMFRRWRRPVQMPAHTVTPYFACCLPAKRQGEGAFLLHRVRFHGEGQA